jgi:hypothetical protein
MDGNGSGEVEPRRNTTRGPLIAAAVVVALLAAYSGFTVDIPPPPTAGADPETFSAAFEAGRARGFVKGQIVGAALIWAGLAWLVVYFGFVRRSGRKVGLKYFLILLLIGVLGATGGAFAVGAI